jgi:hypothetical protein
MLFLRARQCPRLSNDMPKNEMLSLRHPPSMSLDIKDNGLDIYITVIALRNVRTATYEQTPPASVSALCAHLICHW